MPRARAAGPGVAAPRRRGGGLETEDTRTEQGLDQVQVDRGEARRRVAGVESGIEPVDQERDPVRHDLARREELGRTDDVLMQPLRLHLKPLAESCRYVPTSPRHLLADYAGRWARRFESLSSTQTSSGF